MNYQTKRDRGAAVMSTSQEKRVVIDGFSYDVSAFRHPGGNVLNFYTSGDNDASDVFTAFHLRSASVSVSTTSAGSRERRHEQNRAFRACCSGPVTRSVGVICFVWPVLVHIGSRERPRGCGVCVAADEQSAICGWWRCAVRLIESLLRHGILVCQLMAVAAEQRTCLDWRSDWHFVERCVVDGR